MNYIYLICLASTLFCREGTAGQPNWLVSPKVCLTQNQNDSCILKLKYSVNIPKSGQYCLYIDGEKHTCSSELTFSGKSMLTISTDSTIELRNANGDAILTQKIELKYQQSPSYRRRIKTPWSLF